MLALFLAVGGTKSAAELEVVQAEYSVDERAVLFRGPGQPFELIESPRPTPVGAETLVRVSCCTLCTSDLHTHAGRRTEPTPAVLGHEVIGRIDSFGPNAKATDWRGAKLALGDRVSWSVAVHCGACFFCTEDLPQKCESLFKYGHERVAPPRIFTGGLADYVLLKPATAVFRVPDSLPDALAAPANCATATAAAVLRTAGNLAGRTVLVLGAGTLGLTAIAMARTDGAKAVLVSDSDATRRERALAFGAHMCSPPTKPACRPRGARDHRTRADIALELAGVAATVQAE